MSQDLRMDSHKLMFHPIRVADWLKGRNIYPIEAEVSPSGTCNHRCTFCAVDYLEYKPMFLDKDIIIERLGEMGEEGLKSIILSGEGEPLLNKNTPEIISKTKSFNIDVAMSTNGVLLTKEISKEHLKDLSWIRFSVAAGETEKYKAIHRAKEGDFEKVIDNIANAVEIKRNQKLSTTLGVQLLLIPENADQVISMAKMFREIGIDYFTVKPFSKHPKSICSIDKSFDYQDYIEMENILNNLQTDTYKIYFRSKTMNKVTEKRGYNKCFGLPFFVHIDAKANLWPCIAYIGDEKLSYGNLKDSTFTEIWEGEQRKLVNAYFNKIDTSKCRELCRLDEINRYLYKLKNPGEHFNFI